MELNVLNTSELFEEFKRYAKANQVPDTYYRDLFSWWLIQQLADYIYIDAASYQVHGFGRAYNCYYAKIKSMCVGLEPEFHKLFKEIYNHGIVPNQQPARVVVTGDRMEIYNR